MAQLGYVQLTRACIQNCRFCSNPPTGQTMTEVEARAAIDEIAEMGYDGVIFTGGEPTLSPLLELGLEHARERGLSSRLVTNGQLLANVERLRTLADAGLTHIHLSLHSYRPEIHDFITRNPGSWKNLVRVIELVAETGVSCDVNTVINTYNGDHLHETVIWLCGQFDHLRHFVWNNLDPNGNRAEENPDCIPRLREFQVSLELAMEFLQRTGRTFRAERVPLCVMPRFAAASTETRKIVKEEERSIRFLDAKGFVRQREFLHGKAPVCRSCTWDPICAGLYSLGQHYDAAELSPMFDDPLPVIRDVLGRQPESTLLAALQSRRAEAD